MSTEDPKLKPFNIWAMRIVMLFALWCILTLAYYISVMHELYDISGPDIAHQFEDLFFGRAGPVIRITLGLCATNSLQTTLLVVAAFALTGSGSSEPRRRGAQAIEDRR